MAEIKICGITNLEDGLKAAELGVDYVGFVFFDKSPRNVTPEIASEIGNKLKGVKKVGLFVNEDPEKVRNITEEVGLDVLQFHGNENPEYCDKFSDFKVWKALRVKDESSISIIPSYNSIDAFVLDAHVDGKMGGTGVKFDWNLALKAKKYGKNIVLAGGLDPSNVGEAIMKVNPYAVDVSSGVEASKGKKDYLKMKAFVETAKIPSVLLKIVEKKKDEVEKIYSSGDARRFEGLVKTKYRDGISFFNNISKLGETLNLIAEFKKTSPSNMRKGNPDYRENANPEEIARIYEANGASAISVLTDSNFKGKLIDLMKVREAVNLPLLRKDFIIDTTQIYQSKYYGADAILLISAILDVSQMKEYIGIASSLGMDCLVESHNKQELEKSIEAGAKIFGINNRNLHTFEENIGTTLDLLQYVPTGYPIVTESAIGGYNDVRKLSDPRINAMLIGTSLMKSEDIPTKMNELLGKDI